jgi:preprotein translocase subunit SecA
MFIQKLAQKIFGTQNERELKVIAPLVDKINQLEPQIKALSNKDLQGKTAEFKQRLAQGESLDALLPETFAVCREAAFRTIGQRHHDVQLLGGICLHRGKIAEMRTGEGKTLVATLPTYLNALSGRGVHVVTVNDYLAQRDSAWMAQIYSFLGLSTGIIIHGLSDAQRKQSYNADITYGTNNEYGFDYLRDNMKFRLSDYVQRDLHFAIVDEVDSILIDEARTPLIISGPTDDSTDLYYNINKHIKSLIDVNLEDYTIDEKSKTAALTDSGIEKMEARLGIKNLYDPNNIEILHHVNQALRAHVLFKINKDYMVIKEEVVIVDEFTGRQMPGRRWSDGLHQAIEAKEGVPIENENQTLASITFQNFFRMYDKLAGMTGTADTEALEFKQIYKLGVNVIPTNKKMIRKDHSDVIFKTEEGKSQAIVQEIKELQKKGQPVLVGTISVEKSERLSQLLKKEKITHNVLNAKQHEKEADIVAQAGQKQAVTISTNMAGRGTDILLGGNPEVLARRKVGAISPNASVQQKQAYEAAFADALTAFKAQCAKDREDILALGGLFILGTERHESRRIDNQLRGRAGRQGDPGESRFYLSMADDLMRIFGGHRMAQFMEDTVPLEHTLVSRTIENAQRRVESHNYDIRKHLLEYDNVMNQQRTVIYKWRKEVLSSESLEPMLFSLLEEIIDAIAEDFFPGGKVRKVNGEPDFDVKDLNEAIYITFHMDQSIDEIQIDPFTKAGLIKLLQQITKDGYALKKLNMGDNAIQEILRVILLSTIDHLWKDHLLAMDHLREGVGLQGYGQKDPLIEYKKQGFDFFSQMMHQIALDVVTKFFSVELQQAQPEESSGEVVSIQSAKQTRNKQIR